MEAAGIGTYRRPISIDFSRVFAPLRVEHQQNGAPKPEEAPAAELSFFHSTALLPMMMMMMVMVVVVVVGTASLATDQGLLTGVPN